ncbi:MAG: hypothetical protein JJT78_07995 [Leptospira sp.]|nr:hypothetical protein [Leptospira sp.]
MNSLYKTLMFFLGLSLILFSLFLGIDKNKRVHLSAEDAPRQISDSYEFREYVGKIKWQIFQDIDKNWCQKFNCQ